MSRFDASSFDLNASSIGNDKGSSSLARRSRVKPTANESSFSFEKPEAKPKFSLFGGLFKGSKEKEEPTLPHKEADSEKRSSSKESSKSSRAAIGGSIDRKGLDKDGKGKAIAPAPAKDSTVGKTALVKEKMTQKREHDKQVDFAIESSFEKGSAMNKQRGSGAIFVDDEDLEKFRNKSSKTSKDENKLSQDGKKPSFFSKLFGSKRDLHEDSKAKKPKRERHVFYEDWSEGSDGSSLYTPSGTGDSEEYEDDNEDAIDADNANLQRIIEYDSDGQPIASEMVPKRRKKKNPMHRTHKKHREKAWGKSSAQLLQNSLRIQSEIQSATGSQIQGVDIGMRGHLDDEDEKEYLGVSYAGQEPKPKETPSMPKRNEARFTTPDKIGGGIRKEVVKGPLDPQKERLKRLFPTPKELRKRQEEGTEEDRPTVPAPKYRGQINTTSDLMVDDATLKKNQKAPSDTGKDANGRSYGGRGGVGLDLSLVDGYDPRAVWRKVCLACSSGTGSIPELVYRASANGHEGCLRHSFGYGVTNRPGQTGDFYKLTGNIIRRAFSIMSYTDRNGRNAMHMAAEGGHLPCLKILTEVGMDVDLLDNDGRSALHYAAKSGHSECCAVLIDLCYDLISMGDKKNVFPIHMAASSGDPDTVELLLGYAADANAVDAIKNTPMHFCKSGAVFALLLEHGANLMRANIGGFYPIHSAAAKPDIEVILAHLALDAEALYVKEKENEVYQAKVNEYQYVDKLSPGFMKKTRSLSARAQKIAESKSGSESESNTEDKVMVSTRTIAIPDLTPVKKGAFNKTGQNTHARAPQRATYRELKDVVNGGTPLHVAVEHRNIEAVAVLLLHGANVSAKNDDKETPLDIAKRLQCEPIISLLLAGLKKKAEDVTISDDGNYVLDSNGDIIYGLDGKPIPPSEFTSLHDLNLQKQLQKSRDDAEKRVAQRQINQRHELFQINDNKWLGMRGSLRRPSTSGDNADAKSVTLSEAIGSSDEEKDVDVNQFDNPFAQEVDDFFPEQKEMDIEPAAHSPSRSASPTQARSVSPSAATARVSNEYVNISSIRVSQPYISPLMQAIHRNRPTDSPPKSNTVSILAGLPTLDDEKEKKENALEELDDDVYEGKSSDDLEFMSLTKELDEVESLSPFRANDASKPASELDSMKEAPKSPSTDGRSLNQISLSAISPESMKKEEAEAVMVTSPVSQADSFLDENFRLDTDMITSDADMSKLETDILTPVPAGSVGYVSPQTLTPATNITSPTKSATPGAPLSELFSPEIVDKYYESEKVSTDDVTGIVEGAESDSEQGSLRGKQEHEEGRVDSYAGPEEQENGNETDLLESEEGEESSGSSSEDEQDSSQLTIGIPAQEDAANEGETNDDGSNEDGADTGVSEQSESPSTHNKEGDDEASFPFTGPRSPDTPPSRIDSTGPSQVVSSSRKVLAASRAAGISRNTRKEKEEPIPPNMKRVIAFGRSVFVPLNASEMPQKGAKGLPSAYSDAKKNLRRSDSPHPPTMQPPHPPGEESEGGDSLVNSSRSRNRSRPWAVSPAPKKDTTTPRTSAKAASPSPPPSSNRTPTSRRTSGVRNAASRSVSATSVTSPTPAKSRKNSSTTTDELASTPVAGKRAEKESDHSDNEEDWYHTSPKTTVPLKGAISAIPDILPETEERMEMKKRANDLLDQILGPDGSSNPPSRPVSSHSRPSTSRPTSSTRYSRDVSRTSENLAAVLQESSSDPNRTYVSVYGAQRPREKSFRNVLSSIKTPPSTLSRPGSASQSFSSFARSPILSNKLNVNINSLTPVPLNLYGTSENPRSELSQRPRSGSVARPRTASFSTEVLADNLGASRLKYKGRLTNAGATIAASNGRERGDSALSEFDHEIMGHDFLGNTPSGTPKGIRGASVPRPRSAIVGSPRLRDFSSPLSAAMDGLSLGSVDSIPSVDEAPERGDISSTPLSSRKSRKDFDTFNALGIGREDLLPLQTDRELTSGSLSTAEHSNSGSSTPLRIFRDSESFPGSPGRLLGNVNHINATIIDKINSRSVGSTRSPLTSANRRQLNSSQDLDQSGQFDGRFTVSTDK